MAYPFLLYFPPRPAAWPHMKDAGSEHLPPSRYDFPESTHCAAPAWAIQTLPLFFHCDDTAWERRGENSAERNVKPSTFTLISQAPCWTSVLISTAAMRQGPACPTAGILFITQTLVIQIKEVVISPYSSPMPITFAFISCFRIYSKRPDNLTVHFRENSKF